MTTRKPPVLRIAAATAIATITLAASALAAPATGGTPSDKPKPIHAAPAKTEATGSAAPKRGLTKAELLKSAPAKQANKRRSTGGKKSGGDVPPSPPMKQTSSGSSGGGGHSVKTGGRKQE